MKTKLNKISLLGSGLIVASSMFVTTIPLSSCSKQDATSTVTGIEVSKNPTKMDYTVGQSLDLDGMVVRKVMSDNSKVELKKSEYTTEPVDGTRLTEVEDKKVRINLLNSEISKYITVTVSAQPVPEEETIGKLNLVESGEGYRVDGLTNPGTKIKTITVPEKYEGKKILEIKKGAFANCPNLVNLTLPFIGASQDATGVDAMFGYIFGDEMYEGCGAYTWQEYDDSVSGTIYQKYAIPNNIANVVITNPKQVAPGAFSNCKYIESITLNNTANTRISRIGNKAFYYCSGLYEFTFPSKLNTIESAAFENCYALESIVLPETTNTVGDNAFTNCISASSVVIPSSVEYLGKKALSNIIGGVILLQDSEAVVNEKIREKRWDSTWTEETVSVVYDFKSESSYKYLDDWLVVICGSGDNRYGYLAQWMGNWQQSTITVPGSVTIDDKVLPIKTIGARCFSENIYIKILNFEEGIEYIYPNTFEECTALTYVNFPSTLKEIRSAAFINCSSLVGSYVSGQPTDVLRFNEGLLKIGDQAFRGCSSILDVKFDVALTTIGAEAFAFCTHLCPDCQTDTDNALSIPYNCTDIGEGAFKYCFKYAPSTFTGSPYNPTIRFEKGDAQAPQIKNIPKSCFEGCGVRELKSTMGEDIGTSYPKYIRVNVDLNNAHIEVINDGAFKYCYMMNLRGARYTHIRRIGDYAFTYARMTSEVPQSGEGKQDLQMDQEIEYIGDYAFAWCNTIQSLTFNTEVDPDETIPSTEAKGFNSLKHLGQYAFYACSNLEFTTLDLSVCPYLTNYTNSDVEGVEPEYLASNTPRYAFAQCTGLTNVKLPDVNASEETLQCTTFTRLPERMFEGCTNLGKYETTPIVVPEQINDIRSCAFNGCKNIQICQIDGTLKWLGDSVFSSCTSLQKVTKTDGTEISFVENMDYMGSSVFYQCEKLTNPPILRIYKNKACSINGSNYFNNLGLTKFTVPGNIYSIGGSCFWGCKNLVTLNFDSPSVSNPLSINASAFSGCTSLVGSLDADGNPTDTLDLSSTNLSNLYDKAFEDCTSLTKIKLPNRKITFYVKPFENTTDGLIIYFANKNTQEFTSEAWTDPDEFHWAGNPNPKFYKPDPSDDYYVCDDAMFGAGSIHFIHY